MTTEEMIKFFEELEFDCMKGGKAWDFFQYLVATAMVMIIEGKKNENRNK